MMRARGIGMGRALRLFVTVWALGAVFRTDASFRWLLDCGPAHALISSAAVSKTPSRGVRSNTLAKTTLTRIVGPPIARLESIAGALLYAFYHLIVHEMER